MYKKKIFVTIITPNYNGDKFLEYTINSVINQSCNDYEYLVFDANSNDNSHKILKKYQNKIDKIIIEKDNGVYHAVDKAIKIARGKIILWINSDDILDKNAVLNVKKVFESTNVDWITGINGYIKKNITFSGIAYLYPTFILKNGLAHHNYWGFVQQESVAFKKSLYLKSGGFKSPYGNAGDYHLWKNFSKHSSLNTYWIKIGYFRSWSGQNSKLFENKYFLDTGKRKNKISLRLFRFIISFILMPLIILKSFFLLKIYKRLK